MYSFRDKELFLQSFHPLTMMAYAGVLVFLTLACNHPVLLSALYIVLLVNIKLVDAGAAYKKLMPLLLIMTALVIIINPLFSQLGSTVLFSGPPLPVLGRISLTLEALLYGAAMALRMLVVITIFFLYNRVINPDRAFTLLARLAPTAVMLVTLTTRLIPYLAVRLKNIKEVQQTRSVAFDEPGLRTKINSYYPLLKVMMLTSLESALCIAEAIHSRAYGSGPRSYYNNEKLRRRDLLVLSASMAALILGIALLVQGWARYQFYPQPGLLFATPRQMLLLIAVAITVALPGVLNWGWNHWPYLRWRL